MKPYPLIGMAMATRLEAAPFISGLDLRPEAMGPFSVYKAENIVLTITGMGQTNAAMACTCMCMRFSPACLVNIGAAGAAAGEGFALGGIYHVSEAVAPDRLHFRTGRPFVLEPDVLPGFRTARVATRDQAVVAPENRRNMARLAELSDMEGAAVIQVARKFKIPCFLFKFVSDTPEHITDTEIPANIRRYRDSLFDFFNTRVLPELQKRFGLRQG